MVGGNFRLNTSDNNSEISFTPSAGAFIVDNLALGGNFSLGYSKSGNNKYTTFGIGPFARYYFTTESQAVRPIIHGSFNYLSTKQKIGNVSSTNNGTNFFIGVVLPCLSVKMYPLMHCWVMIVPSTKISVVVAGLLLMWVSGVPVERPGRKSNRKEMILLT